MKNELLAMNPKALQFLHHAKGFDFCKPYEIHRIDGRFTFNQVKKLIPEGHAAALLVCWGDSILRYVRTDKLIYVTLTESGFDADQHDFVRYWDYRQPRGTHASIDYESGKSTFEERRKKAAKHCYVIHQLREYMCIPSSSVPIEDNTRYSFRISYNDLYIHRKGYNEKEYKYNASSGLYGHQRSLPTECIDKSGYLLDHRRADLIRRAAALRAERQKAAADVADFTEQYTAALNGLQAAKKDLAAAIIAASDYESMSQYARRCYDLGHAADWLNTFAAKVENKTFKSPAAMQSMIDRVNDYINKEV